MKKFPVTSSKGYEYLAKIHEYTNICDDEVIKVCLYKVVQTKGLFGKTKEKHILLSTSRYDETDKEFFNYVLAVKSAVADYEKSSTFIKWENQESNLKQFEDWNGDCRES